MTIHVAEWGDQSGNELNSRKIKVPKRVHSRKWIWPICWMIMRNCFPNLSIRWTIPDRPGWPVKRQRGILSKVLVHLFGDWIADEKRTRQLEDQGKSWRSQRSKRRLKSEMMATPGFIFSIMLVKPQLAKPRPFPFLYNASVADFPIVLIGDPHADFTCWTGLLNQSPTVFTLKMDSSKMNKLVEKTSELPSLLTLTLLTSSGIQLWKRCRKFVSEKSNNFAESSSRLNGLGGKFRMANWIPDKRRKKSRHPSMLAENFAVMRKRWMLICLYGTGDGASTTTRN